MLPQTLVFYHRKCLGRASRSSFGGVTITKYRKKQQIYTTAGPRQCYGTNIPDPAVNLLNENPPLVALGKLTLSLIHI